MIFIHPGTTAKDMNVLNKSIKPIQGTELKDRPKIYKKKNLLILFHTDTKSSHNTDQ